MAIRREYLECDGSIEPRSFQAPDRPAEIYVPGTERQVEIGAANFVVVQMDVTKAIAEDAKNFFCRVVRDHQIRVADIEVKSKLGQRFQQFA